MILSFKKFILKNEPAILPRNLVLKIIRKWECNYIFYKHADNLGLIGVTDFL